MPAELREQIRAVVTGKAPWPMFVCGSVGAGKTCAILCVLDRCLFSRRYVTAQQFCEDASSALRGELWDGEMRVSHRMFWERWNRLDLTCMDELGSRSSRDRVSDHHYESIKRAIDERQGEPSVWISNLLPHEIANVYDDRIASRLCAGTVINWQGPDMRLGGKAGA